MRLVRLALAGLLAGASSIANAQYQSQSWLCIATNLETSKISISRMFGYTPTAPQVVHGTTRVFLQDQFRSYLGELRASYDCTQGSEFELKNRVERLPATWGSQMQLINVNWPPPG